MAEGSDITTGYPDDLTKAVANKYSYKHMVILAGKDGLPFDPAVGIPVDLVGASGGVTVNVATGNFAVLGSLTDTKVTNADQASASIAALTRGMLDRIEALVAANHTDLAALATALALLHTDDTGIATQTTIAAVLAKLTADPATQTTSAAILAKLTADPATQTTLAAVKADLDTINTNTLAKGSASSANSSPVVIASDQAAIPVSDNGPAWTSAWGLSNVPFTSADQHSAVASVTDAPTSGKSLVLDDIIVSVDTAMNVTFKEETSGTVMAGPFYLAANSGPVQITLRGKRKLPTVNKKLQVITSVAGNISVLAGYHSE